MGARSGVGVGERGDTEGERAEGFVGFRKTSFSYLWNQKVKDLITGDSRLVGFEPETLPLRVTSSTTPPITHFYIRV